MPKGSFQITLIAPLLQKSTNIFQRGVLIERANYSYAILAEEERTIPEGILIDGAL